MSTQAQESAIPADVIGNRLMLARAFAGHLSIREAALKSGIGRGAWQNWERNKSEPSVSEVARIAAALGADFDWLARGGPLAAVPPGPRRGPGHRSGGSAGNHLVNAAQALVHILPVHRPAPSLLAA